MVGYRGLRDHANVLTVPPFDGQTDDRGGEGWPRLILPGLKAERGTGGEQRGEAEEGGKAGERGHPLSLPPRQPPGREPCLAPLCSSVRPPRTDWEALKVRDGGRGHDMREGQDFL